ncbi:hypothetical protein [Streptomyces acidiscabies]|uniref:hypothetical protein n=1 Tax=Streptomyces acidiscabies TaxID=42234 RepID=UPI0038F618AD
MVSGTPAWALSLIAGGLLLALLAMAYVAVRTLWRAAERKRLRRREDAEKAKAEAKETGREAEVIGLGSMGRQAYVALGGMAVSVYGMWGFALQTAKLPEAIAVGFIAMFDAMELVLFSQLYQRANPKAGWTTQLRLIHNTAWVLVAVSATANFIHAPNSVAAPFMAAMPVGAAWVIELEFRARMQKSEKSDDTSKAGPVRLLVLLWTKGWAAAFSGLGLDPNSTSGQVARAALAKKAATRLFRLRGALERHAKLLENREAKRRDIAKAVNELDALRRKTTAAMDRSDFALDSAQALAVLRGLAGWTRVDDVATVDTSDTPAVMKLMEEVAILPSAKRIENAERAAELEAQAGRAAQARAEAEAARERAEEAERAAVEQKKAAETARQKAEDALAKAAEETREAKAEAERAEDARQRAEAARQRAEEEMSEEAKNVNRLIERAEEEEKRLAEVSGELTRVQNLVADETALKQRTADESARLRDELDRLANEQRTAKDTARVLEEEARTAASKLKTLTADLVEVQHAVEEHTVAAERAAELRRKVEEEQARAVETARRTRAEAAEAQALLDSLRPQLADRLGGPAEAAALAEAPAFRSEAKQTGWELYLESVTSGQEPPTAVDLAGACGVSDGNARNWLLEFGRIRAAMIAKGGARQTDGETARSEARHAASSGARQEPSGYRADGHERAEDAERARTVGGQRQPV